MTATLQKAFGYQGDALNLPARDLTTALPFYETVLGFRVRSRGENAAQVSGARPRSDRRSGSPRSNGGDSSQDGCAFHVTELESLFAEFKSNGLLSEGDLGIRDGRHDDAPFRR